MSLIISVVNQKGGVGKTTSSVNLSASLADRNYKILLVDLDPQAHSTEHLGCRQQLAQNQNLTILESFNDQALAEQVVIETYIKNLFILPADLRLGQFNQQPPQGRQFVLKKILQKLKQTQAFDFIFIDCQPSLSLLTLNALTSSNKVLLPVQAEFFALDGLSQLIYTLKEVQTKLHPSLSILGVLITMYDRRNKLSSEVKNELSKNFQQELFVNSIPRSVKLAEAPSFGKSIFDYAPSSIAAAAYQAVAQEILDRFYKVK